MNEHPRQEPATSTTPPAAGKQSYERPTLRALGAVHLMTRGTALTANGDAGQNMMNSDPRLKQDIVRVGDHPLGIGLYLFTYREGHRHLGAGRQFGVMADEVEAVMPDAVSRDPDGFRTVNYAMLGIARVIP